MVRKAHFEEESAAAGTRYLEFPLQSPGASFVLREHHGTGVELLLKLDFILFYFTPWPHGTFGFIIPELCDYRTFHFAFEASCFRPWKHLSRTLVICFLSQLVLEFLLVQDSGLSVDTLSYNSLLRSLVSVITAHGSCLGAGSNCDLSTP